MDIIVDIDGTLADCAHRLGHIQKRPKDWDAFFAAAPQDRPIGPVVELVKAMDRAGHKIIFCSGRPGEYLEPTSQWLHKVFGWWPYLLFMRQLGDRRDDQIVKRELLANIRAAGFDPVLAIDDRSRVVKMWREEGLICAQIAEGDF